MDLVLKRTTISYFDRHFLVGRLLIFLCLFLFANPRDQLGDVNNDFSVDVQDIVLVVDIILTDGIEYSEYEMWASDVNIDETTDVVDIVLMIPVILATDDCEENFSPCIDDFSLCCRDTTSHNFTSNIDIIGIYGTRSNDVTYVNENDIWVVGGFSIQDSSYIGIGYINYNAAHWDGTEWDHMVIYLPVELHNFSEDDIWVTSFSFPLH